MVSPAAIWHREISVVIFATHDFDPTIICLGSLSLFAYRLSTQALVDIQLEDVNGDGMVDMVLFYETSSLDIIGQLEEVERLSPEQREYLKLEPGVIRLEIKGMSYQGGIVYGVDGVRVEL